MFNKFGGVDISSRLLSIMSSGVALPTNAVLFFLLSAIASPFNDALRLPFGFSINDVWWWLDEVSLMFSSFLKWGEI